jgi:hypothetical protein
MKYVNEANIVLIDSVGNDRSSAGLDHPLEPMVAIFALEEPLRQSALDCIEIDFGFIGG